MVPTGGVHPASLQIASLEQAKRRRVGLDSRPSSADCAAGLAERRGICLDKGWRPIPIPRGHQLVTLKDAGTYITKLPKAEHEAPEWQAAMEALILVAENDGPTMFARIGIMRALNRHVERVFNPDRKDHRWGRRKLARDR
jgi:hypothetical protein